MRLSTNQRVAGSNPTGSFCHFQAFPQTLRANNPDIGSVRNHFSLEYQYFDHIEHFLLNNLGRRVPPSL